VQSVDTPQPLRITWTATFADRKMSAWEQSTLTWLLVHLVLLYRVTLGRLLGGQCRFHPTCSQYAIDAVNRYGPWRGSWRTIKRICRCHPWGGRGYDPA